MHSMSMLGYNTFINSLTRQPNLALTFLITNLILKKNPYENCQHYSQIMKSYQDNEELPLSWTVITLKKFLLFCTFWNLRKKYYLSNNLLW
jgi:hypothetical protein